MRKFACLSRYYVKTLYQLDLNVLLGMDIKSGWGTPPTQYCEREGLEIRPSHDIFGHANCPSGRWPEPTCCRIEARGFYRANGNQWKSKKACNLDWIFSLCFYDIHFLPPSSLGPKRHSFKWKWFLEIWQMKILKCLLYNYEISVFVCLSVLSMVCYFSTSRWLLLKFFFSF